MTTGVLLAAALALQPLAPPPDPWFGEDKLRHFFTSFVVTSFSASAARMAGLEARSSLYLGAGAAASAGLYKEIQDARIGGIFSGRDLVWDLGGIAAAGLILDAGR